MKKTIFAVMLAIMLAASPVFADSAYTNPQARGESYDSSYSHSYGDHSYASGSSYGASANLGQATFNGWGGSTALGTATANGCSGAITGSRYFGSTSVAGGAAGTVANGTAAGLSGYAGGIGKGTAYNQSNAEVGGSVYQSNCAAEFRGPDQTIARNWSDASFNANAADYSSMQGCFVGGAASGVSLTGMAGTAGGSIATATPGHSFAATGNVAATKVLGADQTCASIQGEGYIQTTTHSNNSYAGGMGSFSYSGKNSGAGISVMNSTATGNGTSFSARSTGFSAAKSK